MKKRVSLMLAGMVVGCAIDIGQAQEPATQQAPSDVVTAGHNFAVKVCAACHVVAKDQKSSPILKPPAPSFSELVRRQNLSEDFLRQFLSSPHGNIGAKGKMPSPQLVDYQIDEVVAYLLSLRGRR
ncbi:MAG: cytochrome c [Methylocystis silviterrae]|uniref:c-type cytochrome n=1 Tax=Methylocystis silviterrae TaxID=2743612 RepID=UPI003C7163C5